MPLHPKQITSRITKAQDLPALAAVQLEFGTAFNVIHLYAFWDRLKKIVMKDPQQRRTLRDTWANQLVPVCDQTALLLPELDARNVAALAYTLAKTGLHQSPPSDRVWDALDAIAERKIVQMDAQAVVNMAWAFATARRYSTPVFAAIALKAAKMLKQAHAQGLSNLAWAYATSGAGHDSPALFDAIAREASGRLDEFNAQGLANTAWGFASADHPAPELFDAIAAEAGSRLAEFKAQDFAQIAWAFATAGHTTSTLFEQLAGAVEEHLGRFKPQELANMVWAFAKAEQDSPPLLEAIATEATVRLRLFSTQELIIVALSFAKARYHAPSLFDHLAIEAAGRLHEFKALDYANLLWSFAAIGLETTPSNAELYAALASKVEVRLGDFQAQGLTNMAWALAVLNPPSTGTLFASPKFVNACAARAEHLTTADLVRLHQWTIWRDERGGEWPNLPPPLLERSREAFRNFEVVPSSLQRQVMRVLEWIIRYPPPLPSLSLSHSLCQAPRLLYITLCITRLLSSILQRRANPRAAPLRRVRVYIRRGHSRGEWAPRGGRGQRTDALPLALAAGRAADAPAAPDRQGHTQTTPAAPSRVEDCEHSLLGVERAL